MSEELLLAPFRLPPWGGGLVWGAVCGCLAALATRRALSACAEADRGWSWRSAIAGAVFGGVFAWMMLRWHCQETPVVRPSEVWWYWRIGYHEVLIALMIAATATDLRNYLIPDVICVTGVVIGVGLALLSGELQIEHVWVDWNQELPQLRGAYIPGWIAAHPHWHGLAWSLAGAALGAGGTWLIRGLSSFVLGEETMGLGDVTLMGMIGGFLGWQPIVFVLLLAPLCALLWSALAGAASTLRGMLPVGRRTSPRRPYLPYGPFLCLATYVVLVSWRWVWMWEYDFGMKARQGDRLTTFAVRRFFGDWPSLLVLVACLVGGMCVLLGLRRLYLAIPVRRGESEGVESRGLKIESSDPGDPKPEPGPESRGAADENPPGPTAD